MTKPVRVYKCQLARKIAVREAFISRFFPGSIPVEFNCIPTTPRGSVVLATTVTVPEIMFPQPTFTVKPLVSVAEIPPGRLIVTSRLPVGALLSTVIKSEIVVAVMDVIDAVTPVPLKLTPVASVRFVPDTVAVRFLAP